MKTIVFLVVAVLAILFVIGWVVSWGLVPMETITHLPGWLRIMAAIGAILFGGVMLAGYVADSGVMKRMFRK